MPLALAAGSYGAISGPITEHVLSTQATSAEHHMALIMLSSPSAAQAVLNPRFTQIGLYSGPDPAAPGHLSVLLVLAAEFDPQKDGSNTEALTYSPNDPCPVCSSPLGTGMVIMAESAFFHSACFTCCICATPLGGSGYYLYPDVDDPAASDPDGPDPAFYCQDHMASAAAVRSAYQDKVAEQKRAQEQAAAAAEAERARAAAAQNARSARARRGRDSMRKRSEALEITAASANDLAEQSLAAQQEIETLRAVSSTPSSLERDRSSRASAYIDPQDESGADPPAPMDSQTQKQAVKTRAALKRQAALAKTVALHEPDETQAARLLKGASDVENAYPALDPSKAYTQAELGHILDQLQAASLGLSAPSAAAAARLRIRMKAVEDAAVAGDEARTKEELDGLSQDIRDLIEGARAARKYMETEASRNELDGALGRLRKIGDQYDAAARRLASDPEDPEFLRVLRGLRHVAGREADNVNALTRDGLIRGLRDRLTELPPAIRAVVDAARAGDMATLVPAAKELRAVSGRTIETARLIADRVHDPRIATELRVAASALGNDVLGTVEAAVDLAKDPEDNDAKARIGQAVKGVKSDMAQMNAALDALDAGSGTTPEEREGRAAGILDALVDAVNNGDADEASRLATQATQVYSAVADDARANGQPERASQISSVLPSLHPQAVSAASKDAPGVTPELASTIAVLRGPQNAEADALAAGAATLAAAQAGDEAQMASDMARLTAALQQQVDAARLGAEVPGLDAIDMAALLAAADRVQDAIAGLTSAMTPAAGADLEAAVAAAVKEALEASRALGTVMDASSPAAALAAVLGSQACAALDSAQKAAARAAAGDASAGPVAESEAARAAGLTQLLGTLTGDAAEATSRPEDAKCVGRLLHGQNVPMEASASRAVATATPGALDPVKGSTKAITELASGITANTLSPYGLVDGYAAVSKHLLDELQAAVSCGSYDEARALVASVRETHTALARVGHEAAAMVQDPSAAAAARSHFDTLGMATETLARMVDNQDPPAVTIAIQLAKAEIAAAQAALAGRLAQQTEAAVLVAQGKKTRALLKTSAAQGDSASAAALMDQSEAQSLRLVAVGRGVADTEDDERVRFVINESTELQMQQGVLRDLVGPAAEGAPESDQAPLAEAVARADALSDNILAALSGTPMEALTPVPPMALLEEPEDEASSSAAAAAADDNTVEGRAGREIDEAARAVTSATSRWEANGNAMVSLAGNVADLLASMSDALRSRDKAALVAAAEQIVALAAQMAEMAESLGSRCPDRILKSDLATLTQAIPSISAQLKMMARVRTNFDGDAPSDPDALGSVVDCATSLSNSVVSVLSASESAVVAMLAAGVDVQDDLRWHRRH